MSLRLTSIVSGKQFKSSCLWMDAYQAYLVIYLNAHMNVVSPELFVLAVMCHLYDYPQNHTLNLFLLGLLTVAMSLSIGISSSMALRTCNLYGCEF